MKHVGTQKLETKRLILRRYEMEDAEAMFKNWASDAEVTKYLTWPPHANVEVTQSIIKEWIDEYQDDNYYHWTITLKENGDEAIGDIGVMGMKEDIALAHIGYCLGKKWWNKGIMSEALSAVVDFLFDTVDMKRVESRHDPRNIYSGKVMLKVGMKYEGTMRSADCNNLGICDASFYGLLKSER